MGGSAVMRQNKTMSSLILRCLVTVGLFLIAGSWRPAQAAPLSVTFTQSAESIEAYDFFEVTLNIA